jgi:hypothetical protein
MSSPALTVANLDFEYELSAPKKYHPSAKIAKLFQTWEHVLRLLPGFEEAECVHPSTLTTSASPDRLVFWGVTPRTVSLAERLGLEEHFPTASVVREVNDKRFSHELEGALNIALPHSQVVESPEQLQAAVADCPHRWVLKHPFGVSGRDRMLGQRREISHSALGWARRLLEGGWTLVFEAWVEDRDDFSLHFDVHQNGCVEYLGHTQLVNDQGGVYRGNRVLPFPVHPEALQTVTRAVKKVATQGYWGPVGVDGLSGRLGDETILRPLVEINARYSFGRLALALKRWFPKDWCYRWWHPSRAEIPQMSEAPLPELAQDLKQSGYYKLPDNVDPAHRSGTVVVVASSPGELQQLEESLVRSTGRPGS